MDTAKWPQEFVVKPMNEIVTNTTTCLKQANPNPAATTVENRKPRPEKDQALNCPRCNSLNTKFCYYNNYSLTQPRYFCKDCRRYWTEGGSLRNIPIGGGVRKNKRSSSNSNSNSSSPSSSSKKALYTPPHVVPPQLNPTQESAKVQDLRFSSQGFGIGHHQSIPEFMQALPSSIKHNNNPLVSTSSALELLGISNNSRPPFMPFPIVQDSSLTYNTAAGRDMGFGMSYPQFQEFMRPSALGFSLDGGGDHHTLQQEEGSTNRGRPLLPFESLKLPVSSSSTNSGGNGDGNGNENSNHHQSDDHEHEKEGDQSVGFWSGMLSAGASSAASGGTGTTSWQ